MITREIDYAIRALLYLALHSEAQVVSTTVLAEQMEIPYRFLRRILLGLVDAGLVISVRGKQGGLRLAKAPEMISLFDLVKAVDRDALALNICLADIESCHRAASCVVHDELARIQEPPHWNLADVTLAVFVERERQRLQRAINSTAVEQTT